MQDELYALVVDPDIEAANRIATLVKFLGYQTRIASSALELQSALGPENAVFVALVAVDDGHQLLTECLKVSAENNARFKTCLVTEDEGPDTLPANVRSLFGGVISIESGYGALREALESAASAVAVKGSKNKESARSLTRHLVGLSSGIQDVRDMVSHVADTEATALITGESGTGKEVVAQCIHRLSSRHDKPFVPVNCGAIPPDLLESELFGHEKGAFTGAISSRRGRFEVAEGGTLFLDEIGDMPMEMQVKLLRVLQERTFERVGSDKSIRADVRIVAATHQNLEQLVAEGKFRLDLLYRINVFPIEIPPLRKRAADIPMLVEVFARRLERDEGRALQLSECTQTCLANYFWPGNVRELFNLLERLSILHPGKTVKWNELPEKFRPNEELFGEQPEQEASAQVQDFIAPNDATLPSEGIDLRPHLAAIERKLMTQALTQSEWVVARAAKLLNLQRTTLVEKMRKFQIQRPDGATEI